MRRARWLVLGALALGGCVNGVSPTEPACLRYWYSWVSGFETMPEVGGPIVLLMVTDSVTVEPCGGQP